MIEPEERTWVDAIDLDRARSVLGARAYQAALASELRYTRAPALARDIVRAVLGGDDSSAPAAISVAIETRAAGSEIYAACSRCPVPFGACVHVAVLIVDLALCDALRATVRSGRNVAEHAERAPERRRIARAAGEFDTILDAWLAPAARGLAVDIAATPFAQIEPRMGRSYGDPPERDDARSVSVTVRRTGERKLLTARDIVRLADFGAADRRVLEHVRDFGTGRKAASARGVSASLAIEAMRAHGRIFADGFKAQLDFRAEALWPALTMGSVGSSGPNGTVDEISAVWIGDGGISVPFADAVFFRGPFPFVWTRNGAIHRVAGNVDLDVVAQLARRSVLVIPPGKKREAGARLLRAARGCGIDLPAPEHFGLPPVETPRFVLRLEGDPLDFSGEFVACYRAREIPIFPGGALQQGPSASNEGRDLESEGRARAHLEASGLCRAAQGGVDAEGSVDGAQGGPGPAAGEGRWRTGASDDAAIAFWQKGLASLRAATDPAIEVRLSERLARVRVGAALTGRVRVALEGDWLATRVEFSSSELAVELDTVRSALSRKKRWVTLSDGTVARISASIEALAGEAIQVLGGGEGRLAPHQLGRVDRWIEENDGQVDAAVDALRRRLRALVVSAEPRMPSGLRATLRPYQRLGLSWLQFLQALRAGGVLADDMGLGKTITALAFLLERKEAEGPAPSLVVCPTSVAGNWMSESARFTPDLRALLYHGPGRDRASPLAESDLVVTTYALLRRDVDALSAVRFRCVVLDEAQNIKNADSATTRAANRLDAEMRLALSGTPVENRLRELWSLASFANPGIVGTCAGFEKRYERPIAADPASPLSAELRAVVRPFLLRRTKSDVLRELPPKTEIDRFVVLARPDKRLYDALAHSLRASVARDLEKRQGASLLSVFTALTRLRQMACDPRLVDPRLEHHGAQSAKREAFLELVSELVAEGRRALVFSQFVELLTLWRRDLDARGIAYEYLDGGTTNRDRVVDRFQNGSAPLFLISLKAGGAGLNLTAADTVVHCDPWWNPAVEDQATDRAHRIGQDKPVTVVRLVARGTIEEKILALKAKKRELARAVVGDDARALEGLTDADVRLLLGNAHSDDEDIPEPEEEPAEGLPTDVLATATAVLDAEYRLLGTEVRSWLETTGRLPAELAALTDIPLSFAQRLARGEPFPCSRMVAERIRARLKAW